MSAVTLPQKAGYVATTKEWDDLVRIAENLAAQVVQRDAALRGMQAECDAAQRDLIHVAEQWHASEKARDAARAEVARLTAALTRGKSAWANFVIVMAFDRSDFSEADQFYFDEIDAALRQPAPAPAQGQE